MKQDEAQELGSAHALAVAAALAMLGMSVGVNVQELLAAPADQIQSDQSKTEDKGIKRDAIRRDATQNKVPAVQIKKPVMSRGVEAEPPDSAPEKTIVPMDERRR